MRAEAGLGTVRERQAAGGGRKSRLFARLKRLGLPAALAVPVVLLAVGIGFAGSPARLAAGVTVAGVEMEGMTLDEARALLEERGAEAALDPITFSAADERWAIA